MADRFAAAVDAAIGALRVIFVTDDTGAPPQEGDTLGRIVDAEGRVRVSGAAPAGSGPLVWNNLTLQNAWVNFNAATHASAQYAKDEHDIVRLRGMIKSGVAVAGTVLSNVPVGFRPPKTVTFAAMGESGGGSAEAVEVLANGDVVLQTAASSVYLSLSGITFSITP